ncbi:serine/arginine repetitive matrix protein 1-like [Macrobrachium nipponense]|uniref:serine/arginine repetitive matrix protein 1-like n=1 Tax=Macrobrachium nipponense TaxID=159736 RepID=UPI0030C7D26F
MRRKALQVKGMRRNAPEKPEVAKRKYLTPRAPDMKHRAPGEPRTPQRKSKEPREPEVPERRSKAPKEPEAPEKRRKAPEEPEASEWRRKAPANPEAAETRRTQDVAQATVALVSCSQCCCKPCASRERSPPVAHSSPNKTQPELEDVSDSEENKGQKETVPRRKKDDRLPIKRTRQSSPPAPLSSPSPDISPSRLRSAPQGSSRGDGRRQVREEIPSWPPLSSRREDLGIPTSTFLLATSLLLEDRTFVCALLESSLPPGYGEGSGS